VQLAPSIFVAEVAVFVQSGRGGHRRMQRRVRQVQVPVQPLALLRVHHQVRQRVLGRQLHQARRPPAVALLALELAGRRVARYCRPDLEKESFQRQSLSHTSHLGVHQEANCIGQASPDSGMSGSVEV